MKKILMLLGGLVLLSLGITLILKSSFGADPVTVLFSGIANLLNVSIGRASQMIMMFLIVVVYFVDKKSLGFATIAHALLVGYLLDFFMQFTFTTGALINILGVVTMSAGLALYIGAELGAGALDRVTMILVSKLNLELKYVRIGLDVLFVVLGVALGAAIGYGSLIAVIITGPLIQLFLKRINRLKAINA